MWHSDRREEAKRLKQALHIYTAIAWGLASFGVGLIAMNLTGWQIRFSVPIGIILAGPLVVWSIGGIVTEIRRK